MVTGRAKGNPAPYHHHRRIIDATTTTDYCTIMLCILPTTEPRTNAVATFDSLDGHIVDGYITDDGTVNIIFTEDDPDDWYEDREGTIAARYPGYIICRNDTPGFHNEYSAIPAR